MFTKALSIGWANDHPQKQLEIVHNQYDAVFIALPLAVCIALLPTQALDGLGTVPSVMNSFDFWLGENFVVAIFISRRQHLILI